MAKNFETVVTGDWVVYVPEFADNRDDDDPVTVEIKPMSVRETQRRSGNVRAKPGTSGVKTNAMEIRQETFLAHVRNIHGLTVGGEQIVTAEQLLGTGLSDLVAEIEDALTNISRLDEGAEKNFARRSAGSTGTGNSGTAPNATSSGSNSGTAEAATA